MRNLNLPSLPSTKYAIISIYICICMGVWVNYEIYASLGWIVKGHQAIFIVKNNVLSTVTAVNSKGINSLHSFFFRSLNLFFPRQVLQFGFQTTLFLKQLLAIDCNLTLSNWQLSFSGFSSNFNLKLWVIYFLEQT